MHGNAAEQAATAVAAVVCTAGLLSEHDQDDDHGLGLDDLGDDHSLTQDPTVARIRAAGAV